MTDKTARRLQTYLNAPDGEADESEGAAIYTLLTGDRATAERYRLQGFPLSLRRFIRGKLQRRLLAYLDGLTERSVAAMDDKVTHSAKVQIHNARTYAAPPSKEAPVSPTAHRGRRPDHDLLPDEVKDLYEKNGDTYRRLKQTYEILRTMECAPSCDRYEHLKILADLDTRYREAWRIYDNATPLSAEK